MDIFKLVGSVFVDTAEAEKSLSKTDNKAQSVAKTLGKGVGTAAKWGAGLVAAAGGAVAAVVGVANGSASAADRIDKMSQKIGISRQAFQELDFVCSQNGMSVEQLQTGMKTLTTQMMAAQNGTKSAVDVFAQLGVSATDNTGALKSQETMFFESINALQGMSNETERNALANKLFGKSASELAPLLNSGAGSMEELRKKANELGLVIGDETVNNGVKLTDTMDQLKRSMSALGVNIGGAVMPIVQQFSQLIIDNMPTINGILNQIGPVLSQLFSTLMPPLIDLIQSLLPVILNLMQSLLPVFAQIIEAILPPIIQLVEMILPPLTDIVAKLLPPIIQLLIPILNLLGPVIQLLQPILDLVVAILDPLAELITGLLQPLIEVITSLIGKALGPLGEAFGFVSDIMAQIFSGAVQGVLGWIDGLKQAFGGIIQFIKGVFTGNWRGAWDGIKNIFKGWASSIASIFKTPINFIINGINAFIRGLNKIKIPKWVPGVGGKGFNISTIPNLEEGGILEKGQTGYLEGNGAEAVVPLDQNKKWISAVARDMQDEGLGGSSIATAAVQDILNLLRTALPALINQTLVLDTGELVGATVNKYDEALGRLSIKKQRGV